MVAKSDNPIRQPEPEPLDADERAIFASALERQVLPSQWAEAHRELRKGESSRPGPWRNENAPPLRGIMDIPDKPGVSQVNVMKGAQQGVSDALRNLTGYWAHHSPDPVGLCLPDKDKGRKIVRSYVLPFFERTEPLSALLGGSRRDRSIEQISLVNGFTLHLMWSGSASATASFPMRRTICDEVDKFRPWAGDEPNAVGRVAKRMRSYGDRSVQINVSTPTTPTGDIAVLFDDSTVKLYFHVPCPHCGAYQRLVFPQLKGWQHLRRLKRSERVREVLRSNCVHYECLHCQGRIEESQKADLIRRGRWTTESGEVEDAFGVLHQDAEQVQQWPAGTRIGMHLSALYNLLDPAIWTKIACEHILAEGSTTLSFTFKTETLGEPFEFQLAKVSSNVFTAKAARGPLPQGVVPAWAWALLASVDTQHDHFYCVIRAWSSGMRSHRVWHGKCYSFDELDDLLFRQPWPVDGAAAPMAVSLVLIDSGGTLDDVLPITRTMQVYQYAHPRASHVRAIKGANRPGPGLYWPMRSALPDADSHRRGRRAVIPDGLQAWMVDTHQANDLLAELIARGAKKSDGSDKSDRSDSSDRGDGSELTDQESWTLSAVEDPEYARHMAAVVKTARREGNRLIPTWKPAHSGARHDYRDCEAYQVIAAYMQRIHLLPPQEELDAIRQAQLAAAGPATPIQTDRKDDAWTPTPL